MRRPKWRLNWRAAVILTTLLILSACGLVALNAMQHRRVLASALEQIKVFREAGEYGLALRHLAHYLRLRPDDVEALDLRGRILVDTAKDAGRLIEAANVHEKLLRLDPDGPASQGARRRLIDLYVRQSDMIRASAMFRIAPEMALNNLRYQAAEAVARELIQRGGAGAIDHRLLALALEGRILPGDDRALDEAISEFSRALELDPGDAVAAEHLASILQERKKDPARAEQVLDGLLAARPDDPDVRLVRHRFFARGRRDEHSATELEAAARLAPDEVAVTLSAVREALRRGQTVRARGLLDRIPESLNGDVRVLVMRGQIALSSDRPDQAIDEWRRGLARSGGTDPELTWWLAYTLLQRGRLSEAWPLVAQFRRLERKESPLLQILEASHDERTGRLTRAIAKLERLNDKLDRAWKERALLALGRCHEALLNEAKAIEAYRTAIQLDPESAAPRRALVRMLTEQHLDQAVEEIQSGLSAIPSEPGLLVALAGAQLKYPLQRPPARRDWAEFDRDLERASQAAHDDPTVTLLRADRFWQDEKKDQALALLKNAVANNPGNATLVLALAESLRRAGETGEALATLERASASDAVGDRAALRIERARLLTQMGLGRQARELLSRDEERLPVGDRPAVWIGLGRLLAGQGAFAGAHRSFVRASELQPDDPQPRVELLELALNTGDEATVGQTVETLRTQGGEDDMAWRLGQASALLHKATGSTTAARTRYDSLEEAARLVNAVLADAPSYYRAYVLRGEIFEARERTDEAIADYRRAWKRGAEPALTHLVTVLAKHQRFNELDELRRMSPSAALDRLAIQALLQMGERDQARRILRDTRRDHPGDDAWQLALLEYLGETDEAEKTLAAETEKKPKEPAGWLALIRLQARIHPREDVAATIAKAVSQVVTAQPELFRARCFAAAGDQTAADEAFAKAVAREPLEPEAVLSAASYYESTGRTDVSEATLSAALKRSPDQRPIARRLALSLASRPGDAASWARAWEIVGAGAAAGSEPEERLARAVVLSRSAEPEKRADGIELLETLLADLPADAPAATATRNFLARLLLDQDQPARALPFAASAAARGSDTAAIATYARALIQNKRLDEAEGQLERLARLNPDNPEEAALRVLVIWQRALPKFDFEALERAYLQRENTPGGDALGREAFLLLARLGPNAAPIAERLGRKLARRLPGASWMPAQILVRSRKHEEALALCLTAVREGNPQDRQRAARVALECASGANGAANTLAAAAVLDEAIRVDASSDDLRALKAMILHQQGRYAEEVEIYRELAERHPSSFVILNNLAWALSEGLDQPSEALEYIETLLQRAGPNATFRDTRATILTHLGKYAEAIKEFEELVRAEPTGIRLFHLAHAYREGGRTEQFQSAIARVRSTGLTPDQVDPGERALLNELLAR